MARHREECHEPACVLPGLGHAYYTMTVFQPHILIHRGGKQYRGDPERYFYLKRCGWFVRTRGELEINAGVEVFDGIIGPFTTRAKAKFHLLKVIYQQQPELFEIKPPRP